MAKIPVTTSPAIVIAPNSARQILFLKNNHATNTIHIRHGGQAIALGSNATCGTPLTPGEGRSLSGTAATLAVNAVTASGTADLHYEEFTS